jgi:hypothetical protein
MEKQQKPLVDLTEDEQIRIINETGVLKKIKNQDVTEPHLLVAILLSIPLICCHLGFDYLVHIQFGIESEFNMQRLSSVHLYAYPPILALAYATNRMKSSRLGQLSFLIGAIVASCYLVHYTVDDGTFGALSKTPGIVTIGVLLIIQADLGYAMLAVLCAVAFYYRETINGFLPTGIAPRLRTDL